METDFVATKKKFEIYYIHRTARAMQRNLVYKNQNKKNISTTFRLGGGKTGKGLNFSFGC